jgi:precorrin-2/cobalt-factor-2 C20-methyltransferase
LRQTLRDYETVVLMKAHRRFEQIYALLEETGRLDEAVYVRRVGSASEEVVHDLRTLVGKPLDYLSLIIVAKRR